MTKYKLPVSFSFALSIDVEADTPEQAAEKIYDDYNNNKLDGVIADHLRKLLDDRLEMMQRIELDEVWEDAVEVV